MGKNTKALTRTSTLNLRKHNLIITRANCVKKLNMAKPLIISFKKKSGIVIYLMYRKIRPANFLSNNHFNESQLKKDI